MTQPTPPAAPAVRGADLLPPARFARSFRIPPERRSAAYTAAILVAAAALRLPGLFQQMWLDEIWSLGLAQQLDSPLEVFTRIHQDHNNHLNTLWLYVCGPSQPFFLYRLPAFASGVASVYLAGRAARAWGNIEAVCAMLLTASSFLFIEYSSEARGYSLSACCALIAFLGLRRYLHTRSSASNVWFCLGVIGGFLSHLAFVQFYLAVGVWSCAARFESSRRWGRWAVDLIRLHAVPVAAIALLYFGDVRQAKIGGGNLLPATQVLLNTAALAVGWNVDSGVVSWFAAVFVAVISAAGVMVLRRDARREWLFFGMLLGVAPLVLFGLVTPGLIYTRHFFVNILFFHLLASCVFGWVWNKNCATQAACSATLLVMVAGNLDQAIAFWKFGRGDYRGAIDFMARHTSGGPIVVGSDHDFRNQVLLRFYVSCSATGREWSYAPQNQWPLRGPEWLLTHSHDVQVRLQSQLRDSAGNRYVLKKQFPHAGLCGWTWALYHNAAQEPVPK